MIRINHPSMIVCLQPCAGPPPGQRTSDRYEKLLYHTGWNLYFACNGISYRMTICNICVSILSCMTTTVNKKQSYKRRGKAA